MFISLYLTITPGASNLFGISSVISKLYEKQARLICDLINLETILGLLFLVIRIGLDNVITGESSSYKFQEEIYSKQATYTLSVSNISKNKLISKESKKYNLLIILLFKQNTSFCIILSKNVILFIDIVL